MRMRHFEHFGFTLPFFVDTQKQKLGISFSLIDVVTRQTDIQMQTN